MLDVAGVSVSLAAVIALGAGVGFLAGLYGVGGGFILVPLLSVVLGVPLPVAVGTGLAQMIGTGITALLRHRAERHSELRVDLVMMGGSAVGASAGERTVALLERAGSLALGRGRVQVATLVLDLAFAAFLIAAGWAMARGRRGAIEELAFVRRGPLARVPLPPYVDLPAVPLARVSVLVIAYLGAALGFVGGLLGVGGGILLLPLLIYGFGFPIRIASGTGILALVVTAVSGTLVHARAGHVHLPLALALAVGSTLAAQAGALASSRLPASVLRRGFSVVLGLALCAIAWDLLRRFV